MEYRKRQRATAGGDVVHCSNVGIPFKLLNYTDEVNDGEDNEQDSGKKSVFKYNLNGVFALCIM